MSISEAATYDEREPAFEEVWEERWGGVLEALEEEFERPWRRPLSQIETDTETT